MVDMPNFAEIVKVIFGNELTKLPDDIVKYS